MARNSVESRQSEKVLVVGGGGRESALVWKLHQSPLVGQIYVAPGNAGTAELAENLDNIGPEDINTLVDFAQDENINLTVVGPDKPLAAGIVNQFNEIGRSIYGPTREAARIEWSKIWATEFMKRHNIPHPHTIIPRNFGDAFNSILYLTKQSWHDGIVVKADGLADGKGVVVCESASQAIEAAETMMIRKKFGPAGERIILQKRLQGQEVSVMAIVDGTDFQLLPLAKDYKRLKDNDKGPNTGGMGSYAPAHFINERLLEQIKNTVIAPLILGMKEKGHPFKGTLYTGMMIVNGEPLVIEFNARFGDPETQVQLPLIDVDFLNLLKATIAGHSHRVPVKHNKGAAVCVTLASPGYPDNPQTGLEVYNLEKVVQKENVLVFHAGTKKVDGKIISTGGRVANIVGLGPTVEAAHETAYDSIGKVNEGGYLYGMESRSDIGQ